MILESIVSTLDSRGRVNLAPMGPVIENPEAMSEPAGLGVRFLLRPFEGSRTYENLMATRRAVVHVTDDAALIAHAAIGQLRQPESLVRLTQEDRYAVLIRCHRWFAVEIDSVRGESPRFEMPCTVRESAIERPFFGFNRAKHALIEAAILATRTHLISGKIIHRELAALRPLIEKTADDADRAAFEMLVEEITRRLEAVDGAA